MVLNPAIKRDGAQRRCRQKANLLEVHTSSVESLSSSNNTRKVCYTVFRSTGYARFFCTPERRYSKLLLVDRVRRTTGSMHAAGSAQNVVNRSGLSTRHFQSTLGKRAGPKRESVLTAGLSWRVPRDGRSFAARRGGRRACWPHIASCGCGHQERGSFAVAIAGGSLVKLLGGLKGKEDVDWKSWHILGGRALRSSQRSGEQLWRCNEGPLCDVPIPPENIYAIDESLCPTNTGAADGCAKSMTRG